MGDKRLFDYLLLNSYKFNTLALYKERRRPYLCVAGPASLAMAQECARTVSPVPLYSASHTGSTCSSVGTLCWDFQKALLIP